MIITELDSVENYMPGTFSGIYAQYDKGATPNYKESTLPMSGNFRFKIKAVE